MGLLKITSRWLFVQQSTTSTSKDKKMAELLDDDFIFVRHNNGEERSKSKFLDVMLTGVRDKTASENRRLIYENDDIVVSHSILDGPHGRNAVMLVRLVKDGKFIRAETGNSTLIAK